MDHYITLGARDAAEADLFYGAVLSTIGWSSHMNFPGWRAYSVAGKGEGLTVWTCTPFDCAPAGAGNGTMLGFAAASTAEVDAFHAAALAHGGTEEGPPGLRPHYGPDWYAAYLRDPTGNKLAIVHRG